MKLLFDFFPVLLFFVAFKLTGDDIYIATAVAIAAGIAQSAIFWFKHRRLEKMHVITLVLLVVFGGATLLLQDEVYIKWKPTVLNWLFGLVFIASQFLGDRPVVQRLMGQAITLPRRIWYRLNLVWSVFFIAVGFINLYVVYNFDTDTWVNFKLFGIIGLTLVFIVAQSFYIGRHVTHDPEGGENN
ncbi:MAG: septation protein A [Gammaproteobacteria bacterium]|nr:septation protein A [Gammaproteobacteria bacterium]